MARFPTLENELLNKRLTLTTLSLVASQLTEENLAEVVTAIAGKSREQVEEYRSGFRLEPKKPREHVRPVVGQKARVVEAAPLFALSKDNSGRNCDGACGTEQPNAGVSAKPAFAGESNESVREQRYELRFTIDAGNHKKPQEAKASLLA